MPGQYKNFYSNYKDKLFSYLLYKCGDRDLAMEVTQESFARHLKSYSDSARIVPSLLFTIARNALVDIYRRRERCGFVDIEANDSGLNEEERYIAREESAKVYEAMKSLNEQDRDMLVMAVNGVPYRELADVFNLSVATVKVRIHRARTQLRKNMVDT